jgi:hypothetical protein
MKIKDELERQREIEEMGKDYCLECGVEVFGGGYWGYCVPCGNAVFDKLIEDKLKTTNNTRPNHAVGEVYKPAALNTHDPHEMYAWEKTVPAWVWALRALGALGFITGIYCLVFLGMLL